MINYRATCRIVLCVSSAIVMSLGCSDKTQSPENVSLTKKRQDLINSHKKADDAVAPTQAGASASSQKPNTGD